MDVSLSWVLYSLIKHFSLANLYEIGLAIANVGSGDKVQSPSLQNFVNFMNGLLDRHFEAILFSCLLSTAK